MTIADENLETLTKTRVEALRCKAAYLDGSLAPMKSGSKGRVRTVEECVAMLDNTVRWADTEIAKLRRSTP